ncbi:hypothetical protein BD289DRAFT_62889 [Coniella lustricola]|uniref:Uncharacterized protein n=1 Tax=Coniella lustricola TaxID=2025994 RepID=A0A2T3A091_9PEZI|nr:hypothetical protein BD289DRAFT_62889 [Coniella lustricola]
MYTTSTKIGPRDSGASPDSRSLPDVQGPIRTDSTLTARSTCLIRSSSQNWRPPLQKAASFATRTHNGQSKSHDTSPCRLRPESCRAVGRRHGTAELDALHQVGSVGAWEYLSVSASGKHSSLLPRLCWASHLLDSVAGYPLSISSVLGSLISSVLGSLLARVSARLDQVLTFDSDMHSRVAMGHGPQDIDRHLHPATGLVALLAHAGG